MPDIQALRTVLDALPSFTFPADDLASLVQPHGGAISGLDQLLTEIQALRQMDLGDTAPERLANPGIARRGATSPSPEFSLCRMYRSGERDPVSEVEAAIARIEAENEKTHVFITTNYAAARHAASEARRRLANGKGGPLEGVPFAVKDLFRAIGFPTTAGAPRMPADDRQDAASVAALRNAGAVLLGKTNLHEWAYGTTGDNRTYGAVLHPTDPDRLAGGSSSGSAAAVALGLAAFTLGTDTGGSVRVPAALCGVVGMKPTFGLVSRDGVVPFCWTLDHVGLMTGNVSDAAAVLAVIADGEPRASGSAGMPPMPDGASLNRDGASGLKVGICRAWATEAAEPDAIIGMEEAARALSESGAVLQEVRLEGFEQTRTVSLILQLAEAVSHLGPRLEHHPGDLGDDVRMGLLTGQLLLAEHYVRARRMIQVYTRRLDQILTDVDLLLTPATPVQAPLAGSVWAEAAGRRGPLGDVLTRFTTLFNITGHPAITVPAGVWPGGLPRGIQLVGRRCEDGTVLRAASVVEAAYSTTRAR